MFILHGRLDSLEFIIGKKERKTRDLEVKDVCFIDSNLFWFDSEMFVLEEWSCYYVNNTDLI